MILITKQEKLELAERLQGMVNRRSVIAQAIAEAREKGDLKENADYHAARDEMARNEAMIKDLEKRIKEVTVVDTDEVPEDMVFLGSTVRVKNLKTGETETFRIVGEVHPNFDDDTDIMEVSATSPLGEALMRTRIGQTIRVNAPRGELKYEIVELVVEGKSSTSAAKGGPKPYVVLGDDVLVEAWATDSKTPSFEKKGRTPLQTQMTNEICSAVNRLDRHSSSRPIRHGVLTERQRYVGKDVENALFYDLGLWPNVTETEPVIRFERRTGIQPCPDPLTGAATFFYAYRRDAAGTKFLAAEHFEPLKSSVKLELAADTKFDSDSSKGLWLRIVRALVSKPPLFAGVSELASDYGLRLRVGIPRAFRAQSANLKATFDATITAMHSWPQVVNATQNDSVKKLAESLKLAPSEIASLLVNPINKIMGPRTCINSNGSLNPRDEDLVVGELTFVSTDDEQPWLEFAVLVPR